MEAEPPLPQLPRSETIDEHVGLASEPLDNLHEKRAPHARCDRVLAAIERVVIMADPIRVVAQKS
jgi:hypothetical protein